MGGLLLMAACPPGTTQPSDRSLMHGRVLWMPDPAHQAVISWTTPTAGREHDYYYATTLSERAVILTLNTEISHAGDQREWLEAELERQRAQPGKWVLVQYHVPAYGSVKSYQQGESQRRHWVPLFEEFQVDLVCEADHQSLKRTVPIYEDQEDLERHRLHRRRRTGRPATDSRRRAMVPRGTRHDHERP